MKQIQPVNIWVNGEQKIAEYLDANAINVVLDTTAEFKWALYTKVINKDGQGEKGEQVASGNLYMNNIEYQLWQDDSIAWDFISFKLNLVII